MRTLVLLFGLLALPAAARTGTPDCEGPICNPGSDPDAQRLSLAYRAAATTDPERAQMRAIIARYTQGDLVMWSAAAKEYFDWRAHAEGYYRPPTYVPDFHAMRVAAEGAIRARLIDPSSAQFSWPHGFIDGTWKPLLHRRISGWITCGEVNAKNRMGGYTGASAFVVVFNAGALSFVDMDSGTDRYGLNGMACAKSSFPPPQRGMLDDNSAVAATAGPFSVADELTKLAALRDKGVLTEAEFEAQKAALLAKR